MSQFENFQTSYHLVPLEELLESYIGGDWGIAPESNETEFVNVKCIRATELKNWTIEKAKTAAPRKIKKTSLEKRNLLEGNIILEISGGGPEQPVGRVEVITKEVISSNHGENLVCTNFFRILRPNNQVIPKFLKLYLDFFYLCGPIQKLQSGSNNLRNLKFSDYLKIEVPLPDIEQQESIIYSIEIANGQIDSGVEALCRAEKQLELYRQSVLKDAFEGKLTADWRAANPDLVEPADKLLERIEEERKAAHQAELDAWADAVNQWEANGKNGKKPSKPASISSRFSIINQSDGDLGSEFSWDQICLGDLFGVFVGSTPKRDNPKYWDGSINWISSGEVDFCYLRATKETITNLGLEETSTKLHPPGTLFLAMIGEGKTRGKAAISEVEAAHNQNTAAIRISETSLLPEFYFFFMMYNYEITRTIGSGNNQKALNKARVEAIKVPLTCVAEQKEVIDKMKLALEYILDVKDELRAAKKKAEALKQSILKKAFSGRELLEGAS